mmetsp:Transcript_33896/g.44713  ORF Transcript_33896/g.44713 Transcript_33896/m.44713 type:complete len:431 (+) Transcript_33896:112-1404(+)
MKVKVRFQNHYFYLLHDLDPSCLGIFDSPCLESGELRDRKGRCSFDSCSRFAFFNFQNREYGDLCSQHKLRGMVDKRRCQAPFCSNKATHNEKNVEHPSFCFQHKNESMIEKQQRIPSGTCQFRNCEVRPSFNFSDVGAPRYCKKHQLPGMVDVKHRNGLCLDPYCTRQAKFNFEGETKGVYCSEHQTTGMKYIVRCKGCQYVGCPKMAYFNFEDDEGRKFCKIHKLDGMVNKSIILCEAPQCHKRPVYNYVGLRAGRFCTEHKLDKMINVRIVPCEHPECYKIPGFNYVGEKKGRFCSIHKKTGMIVVYPSKSKKRQGTDGTSPNQKKSNKRSCKKQPPKHNDKSISHVEESPKVTYNTNLMPKKTEERVEHSSQTHESGISSHLGVDKSQPQIDDLDNQNPKQIQEKLHGDCNQKLNCNVPNKRTYLV